MTATGKVDRRLLRERGSLTYRNRQLTRQHERLTPSNGVETTMLEVWMEVLNLSAEAISTDTPFAHLGGDSITGMQVVSRCRARNIAIHLPDLLREQTIRQSARRCTPVAQIGPATVDEEECAWRLSPIQQMFFEIYTEGLNHFNQSFLLKLTRPVSGLTLKKALDAIVARHSMLRARFRQKQTGQWEQFIAKNTPQVFAYNEHTLSQETPLDCIVKEQQESLNILYGPVFAAKLCETPGEGQILFLVAHHLVIDLVSWRILLHEIEHVLCGGSTFHQKTLPFQIWTKLQYESSQTLNPIEVLPSRTIVSQFEYWNLSWSDNRYSEVEYYKMSLDAQTTSLLLGRGNHCFRTEPVDILVATLIHSFRQAFPDRQPPALFLEGHGREPLNDTETDLSETVGWFTTLHPLQIPGKVTDTSINVVKFVKDTRRRVPGKGRPYFACRYQNAVGRKEFKHHAAMELLFNYTGIYQQLESENSLFQSIDRPETSTSGDISSAAQRLALIEITAGVERGNLIVTFGVNRRMQRQARLRKWAELYAQCLKLTVSSLADQSMSWTLSDFPLLPLSYGGLQRLVKERLPDAGIDVGNVDDLYPCTPIQEGILWSRLKGVASYTNSWVWVCVPVNSGESISPSRLSEAWRKMVQRHSILASTFAADLDNGRFIQVLLRDSKPRLAYKRVQSRRPVEMLLEMERPLFRPGEPEHAFTIFEAADGLVACRLDVNHALIDAASVPILVGDLAKTYSGTELPPAPLFRDFVQYVGGTALSEKLTYWTQFLQDVQPCEFPTAETSVTTDAYGLIMLSTGATTRIDTFCRDREITRSVFLQMAWALVLSRYTGMSQICFGYIASGRDAPVDRIEQMVGPLINMLISRTDLRAPLREIAATTLKNSVEHFAFQHMSLAEILRGLATGGKRIFNTAMSVREVSRDEDISAEKIRFEGIKTDDPHEYDITVAVGLARDRTEVAISYRKLTISEHTAQGATSMLETAIAYLLSMHAWEPVKPVSKDFIDQPFRAPDTGGPNQGLPMALWHKKIMSSEARQHLLLPEDYPQVDKVTCVGMKDLRVEGNLGVSETRERRPPATTTERRLQELLATVLKVEVDSIGLEGSILDVGGGSMIAMQLVGAAREQGLSLTVADVFRYPRLSHLAYHISERQNVIHPDPVPFGLLDMAALEDFISQEVPPLVQERPGMMENILPLSDFQRMAVHFALHAPSRPWNYFSIDLPSTVHVPTISASCAKLVNHFDVLRSVFIQARGRYFQVVLENLHLPIELYQENVDINLLCNRIVEEDLERPVLPGQSFVRIMILRGCNGVIRIILRLSHAQYDGVSFGPIMDTLSALYEGRQLAKPYAFANYLQVIRSQHSSTYKYWRSLLRGSLIVTLTQPPKASSKTLGNGSLLIAKKSVSALSTTHETTPANIFTAACAVMLGKISKSDDFVFGRMVSGREGLPGHLQDIVGPCLNAVPVRIQRVSTLTEQDILASIQEQYIDGIPHAAAVTDDLIRCCGDFPENALRSGYNTQYQNVDESPGTELAGSSTRLNVIERDDREIAAILQDKEITITATPQESSLNLSVRGNSKYFDQEMVERMLAELCHALSTLQV